MVWLYLIAEYVGSVVSDKDTYELVLLWQLALIPLLSLLGTNKKIMMALFVYNAYIAITETIFDSFSQNLVPFEIFALFIAIVFTQDLHTCYSRHKFTHNEVKNEKII